MLKPSEGIKEVEVLDAMCGTGKTYNLFKFIHQNRQEHYIYVTPMLSEVASRPGEELAKFGDAGIVFYEPTGEGFRTKGEHLFSLLQSGKNISCTHSLFLQLSGAGREAIANWGYTVIIDEELGMIEPLPSGVLTSEDARLLFAKEAIATSEIGQVLWNDAAWGEGNSVFAQARQLAEAGCLYASRDGTVLNLQLPIDLLRVAKRVIVATYLFEGSVFETFLKVKGIGWKRFTFDDMALRSELELKHALLDRIEFVDAAATTERLYRHIKVPVHDYAARAASTVLSHNWYANARQDKLTKVGEHIRNVARQMGAKTNDLIYTLPSSAVGKRGEKWVKRGRLVKVKSYSPELCYLQKGARATNDYATRTSAIHAYNRYANLAVKTYLQEQGAFVDDDTFALAELIQWFFRTAIRVPSAGNVKLHIVSPRMHKLFTDWLSNRYN